MWRKEWIVRIGRYISLPDIEAQLAPNNYTYTHSLTYTYDCYTQTGTNASIKLSNHWTVQAGFPAAATLPPWAPRREIDRQCVWPIHWRKGETRSTSAPIHSTTAITAITTSPLII